MNFVLCVLLLSGCPTGSVCECSPTTAVSATLPAEQATLVPSSVKSDASTSAAKRLGSRRSSRVIARLERRIARKHRA